MQFIPPINKILVKIDRSLEDEIQLAGGMRLYLDTRLNLEEHVTVKGICVGIPGSLKRDELQNIHPDVRVGDEVYFSYQAVSDRFLTPDIQYYENEVEIKGEKYWIVDYICVFFVKREKEIVMIGGHVLVEPVREDDALPAWMARPDSMKSVEQKDKGKIVAIGRPNKDEPTLPVQPGDIVAFDERYVEHYNFWNKPYFIIKQDRILHGLRTNT